MNLAHAADLAYAAAAPPGSAGGPTAFLQPLLLFGAMFAIFYFLVLRPQQRQKADRERMLSALKRGDRVVTTGGLHGTVTGLERAHRHAARGRPGEARVRSRRHRPRRGGHGRQGCLGTSGLRLGVVAVVLALSLWYLYPPQADGSTSASTCRAASTSCSAWRRTSTSAARPSGPPRTSRAALERKGVGVKRVAREGLSAIVVELANADQLERRAHGRRGVQHASR